ncbi:hypothetical protein ACOSP7_009776 [Xanthoceras sorbifolium]
MPILFLLFRIKLGWMSQARPASLVCKDVLETEKNDVERRELGDELAKAMRELTVRAEHDKQLAAEVWESQVLRKALKLEVKESTFKINELQAGV